MALLTRTDRRDKITNCGCGRKYGGARALAKCEVE